MGLQFEIIELDDTLNLILERPAWKGTELSLTGIFRKPASTAATERIISLSCNLASAE
jgi:hypothetical protein